MNFPRYDEVKNELRSIFAEAQTDDGAIDLSKVKAFGGDSVKAASRIKELNNELEGLAAVKAALDDPASHESGDGAGGASTLTAAASLKKRQRLGVKDSVSDWANVRGVDDDGQLAAGVDTDEAWGAWFKGYATGEWRDFRGMMKNQMGTSPDADGGFLVPTPLSTSVIDLMRASTPIFRAGAQTVPMTSKTLDIARLAADVDASAWHAEHAAITESKPTLERVTFSAKTLPVLVKASRELAEDAPNTGAVVARSIAGAMGVELTRAALRGDGTANSPVGIANTAGIQGTAVGGAASWVTMANAVRDLRTSNHEPNAYIAPPRTATALELQTDSGGQYLAPPPSVEALTEFTTTIIPTNLGTGLNETELYVGDFTRLLVGLRTQLRIEPLRERFADNGQVAWLAWLRVDVQLEHPAAFKLLSGVTN